MRQERFEIEVESRLENLLVIASFVEKVLGQLDVDPVSENKVHLVIDEACTNIIKYAYGESVGPVKLVMAINRDELVIVLNDRGKQFDPRSVPPPDLEADVENRKIGGLGVHLINRLMDEVSYSFDDRSGNTLTMKKRLSLGKNNG
jgi:anti-sigma regulatory factor (Ser/Thr protein kinase)